jgi:hypothetical protein
MKRDPRLHRLSSDHHHALVLARSLVQPGQPWTGAAAAALGARFDSEIEPHFRIEEELLLPALRDAGAIGLVERTIADHAFLRDQAAAARAENAEAARAFGERLGRHVRFEERELFPACEQLLDDAVLDAVGAAHPPFRGTEWPPPSGA